MRRLVFSLALLATCATTGCKARSGGCPLVLAFDRRPVQFLENDRPFDLGDGPDVVTDWPSAETPWLALDRNGNGAIDDGGELFGSDTLLASGERAANGFEALRALDSDGDGRITPADDAWPALLVWSDRNADRVSSPDELAPLARFGVVSIALDYVTATTCNARGDCERQRSAFRYVPRDGEDREGAVIDVYLRDQDD
jgi:hypothetical protein